MSSQFVLAVVAVSFAVSSVLVNWVNRRRMEKARDESRAATRFYLTYINTFLKTQRSAHEGALKEFGDEMHEEQRDYHLRVLQEIDVLDGQIMDAWDSMNFEETSPWEMETDRIDGVLAKWMKEKE